MFNNIFFAKLRLFHDILWSLRHFYFVMPLCFTGLSFCYFVAVVTGGHFYFEVDGGYNGHQGAR